MTRVAPWLSIVGIGEDGRDGLSPAATRLIAQARLVVGGKRHLALAAPLTAETMAWPSPLHDAIPKILARRGEPVCVLASGDPFLYGVAPLLAAAVPPDEMVCLPAPSSLSLAASRLGWALQDVSIVSVHGRDLVRILPLLQPRAKILSLTWDETTPGKLAELLVARGLGGSRLTVLEALGGPRERVRHRAAHSFSANDIDPLNVVAIEVEAGATARLLPIAPGLPDDMFEHDGQITKREMRAIVLSALRPFRGGHLWDVGAGSGSVAIEWALLDPANRATAIEVRPERAARIVHNAAALGVPGIEVRIERAPDVFADLPAPDAIFVGGGGTDQAMIAPSLDALPRGGRLVVNAVTIETQAHLANWHREHGGELINVAIAHAHPIGRYRGWRPAMPIMQWAVTKP
jgi:precorrin-6Y C5,15-methyltransferase (decarboxylating)